MINSINSANLLIHYVDLDDSNLNYPYNCIDVKTNEVVWNFEFEEDALEWCKNQNKKPTFGKDRIPPHMRMYKT